MKINFRDTEKRMHEGTEVIPTTAEAEIHYKRSI